MLSNGGVESGKRRIVYDGKIASGGAVDQALNERVVVCDASHVGGKGVVVGGIVTWQLAGAVARRPGALERRVGSGRRGQIVMYVINASPPFLRDLLLLLYLVILVHAIMVSTVIASQSNVILLHGSLASMTHCDDVNLQYPACP